MDMQLDPFQRLLLMNQYRILEALYPDEAGSFQRAYEVVERGYEWHYRQLPAVEMMSRMSVEASQEIRDILSIFEAIQDAQAISADDALKDNHYLKFHGFSGNEETSLMTYTEFLKRAGEWSHVGHPSRAYSPGPQFRRYQRMLEVWRRQGHSIGDAQLRELVAAAQ